MESFSQWTHCIQTWVWSAPLLLLLVGVGGYLTWALRGLQFTQLGYGLRLAFSNTEESEDDTGDISRFESLMTSLAGAIGTGNIVGIATAIMIGGLGSIFWMWVIALVGMATKYAEAILAVRYRVVDANGEMSGGPMYYIEKGLGWKWMAIAFGIVGALAAAGTGNLVQVHSIADVLHDVGGIDPIWTGIVLAVVTGLVLIGGIHSIGHTTAIMVPFMALIYLAGGCYILITHYYLVPTVLGQIFDAAFTGQAASGGFAGATVMMGIQMGAARGVFTNESGLGISSISAAAAKTDYPAKQALVAMTGTFLSTIVICTMTALVLGVTGVIGQYTADGQVLNGAPMATAAFDSCIPGGKWIAMVALVLFAYSTVVGWAYYGEKCSEYLFGERIIPYYRTIFSLLAIPAAVIDLAVVWDIADILNGLMVLPNLIALFFLAPVVVEETKRFLVDK